MWGRDSKAISLRIPLHFYWNVGQFDIDRIVSDDDTVDYRFNNGSLLIEEEIIPMLVEDLGFTHDKVN